MWREKEKENKTKEEEKKPKLCNLSHRNYNPVKLVEAPGEKQVW